MRTINGIEVTSKEFAYDDSHKFYLIETDEERETAMEYGYNIYPIQKIMGMYILSTDGLRFINSFDLSVTYVGQFEKAKFEGWK